MTPSPSVKLNTEWYSFSENEQYLKKDGAFLEQSIKV